MPPKTIPEPWLTFLRELTVGVGEELILPCLGGFVVTMLYGLERPTADVDVLAIVPREVGPELRRGPANARPCTGVAASTSIW